MAGVPKGWYASCIFENMLQKKDFVGRNKEDEGWNRTSELGVIKPVVLGVTREELF